jgi:hypothetical protein
VNAWNPSACTRPGVAGLLLAAGLALFVTAVPAADAVRYLSLSEPLKLDLPAQAWEGDQQPHTFSVIEMNSGGYRYWAWYGLNHGRGIGLARSDDLLHWSKYEGNPLWLDARWPSVLRGVDPAHPERLYFAITRGYDTPSSRIVLASSSDGVSLEEQGVLVPEVPKQRNQNPNLFRDPVSGRYYLTFYRGNDQDDFSIVSRSARRLTDLARARDRVLLHSKTTVAAPTLLYQPHAGPGGTAAYFMATEIFPDRYDAVHPGEWQVRVYWSSHPDGPYQALADNPVESGGRACLFQHVFDGKFYGYQCKLDAASQAWEMEVVTAALPQ